MTAVEAESEFLVLEWGFDVACPVIEVAKEVVLEWSEDFGGFVGE